MDSSVSLIVPIMVPINGDDMKYWTARARARLPAWGQITCAIYCASIDGFILAPFAH